MSRVRALAPATIAVLVASGAGAAGLAAGTPSAQRAAPACSLTARSDDPVLAADGYVQAAYRAACPRAVTTGISLALYHGQSRSGRSALIAQTDCTAAGAVIDCRISVPCQIGSWDVAVGTTTAYPPGTAAPDFGWMPTGADQVVSACPRFVRGVQTVSLGSTP